MQVAVTGGFDDIRSRDLRFLQEAAGRGDVTVLLWNDTSHERITGKPPKFPLAERSYFLESVRYVSRVLQVNQDSRDGLQDVESLGVDAWVDRVEYSNLERRAFCARHGLRYHVLSDSDLAGFPDPGKRHSPQETGASRKKVIVTGCYDWLHSGHVRFFEEVSAYGDVYAVVGHDANIRRLKGEGHPLLPQEERRYLVGSIRHVTQALISTGEGWLDAEPEMERIKPDMYAVNEDGDRGGKREFCERHGIEFLVLKRTPAPGLPKRSSTDLRGF